jgi:hypothetical protein
VGRAERVTESRHPTFTREEVEEILRRATEHAKAASGDGIRQEELLEAAREAGIDTDSVQAAAAEIAAQREDRREREQATAELAEERRRGWRQSLTHFLIAGAFLTALNLVAVGGAWLFYVLASWGFFVALRGVRLLQPVDGAAIDRRVERTRRRRAADARRQQRKEAAEAWAERLRQQAEASARRADAAAHASRDFEDAVEKGVHALLGALARNIRALAARAAPPEPPASDFGRYVERQRAGDAAENPPPAKVRVELHPRAASDDEDDEATARRKRRR